MPLVSISIIVGLCLLKSLGVINWELKWVLLPLMVVIAFLVLLAVVMELDMIFDKYVEWRKGRKK